VKKTNAPLARKLTLGECDGLFKNEDDLPNVETATLLSLLSTPNHRKLLEEFLKGRFMDETLAFYTAIEMYQSEKNSHSRKKRYPDIFRRFVDPDNTMSPQTVTLPLTMVETIKQGAQR